MVLNVKIRMPLLEIAYYFNIILNSFTMIQLSFISMKGEHNILSIDNYNFIFELCY